MEQAKRCRKFIVLIVSTSHHLLSSYTTSGNKQLTATKFMENTHKKKLGINCKKRNGIIVVGVHLDTFIETFKSRVNDKGWVNFGMLENDEAAQSEFSHKPILLSGGQ